MLFLQSFFWFASVTVTVTVTSMSIPSKMTLDVPFYPMSLFMRKLMDATVMVTLKNQKIDYTIFGQEKLPNSFFRIVIWSSLLKNRFFSLFCKNRFILILSSLFREIILLKQQNSIVLFKKSEKNRFFNKLDQIEIRKNF